ncbi:sialate O-acetylesterase [Caldicellulosiruptoraceae bacterium PP1]
MELRIPKIINDGMILQREKEIKIWGWAVPNEKVSINFLGNSYTSLADDKGMWEVTLPAMAAGGPYIMEIKSNDKTIIIEDILIGDVWICSGQSNMVLPMERVKDRYQDQFENCDNPYIRQFIVPDKYNFKGPDEDFEGGTWEQLNNETIYRFSAVGYFFAKAIYEKYKIPIGLIKACVGGTPIEAWMSPDLMSEFPENVEIIEKLKDDNYIQTVKTEEEIKVNNWYNSINDNDEGLKDSLDAWFNTNINTSDWKTAFLPASWEEIGLNKLIGAVWFRKEVDVPINMIGKPAKLYLGTIVDSDLTYVNGVLVGSTSYRYPPRKYNIPPNILKLGKNVIVTRVISNDGNGEFIKDKDYMLFTEDFKINLEGYWQYKVGAKIDEPIPNITFFQYKPTGLFNGMIAPMIKYNIKGILWYQGESNTDDPQGYCKKLCSLIIDWRKKWGDENLPFLYVQLANYMKASEYPSESNWAKLRDEQRKALCLNNTGMAVAIDVGEWNDLHPLNKKDVGKRLALLAQKIAYNEKNIVASGPLYKSMKIDGNKIIIEFSEIGSGLCMKSDKLKHFSISNKNKEFLWANAIIEGNKVIVWNENVSEPVAVRYAWADNPEGANLYNKEGLPASPFSTEN